VVLEIWVHQCRANTFARDCTFFSFLDYNTHVTLRLDPFQKKKKKDELSRAKPFEPRGLRVKHRPLTQVTQPRVQVKPGRRTVQKRRGQLGIGTKPIIWYSAMSSHLARSSKTNFIISSRCSSDATSNGVLPSSFSTSTFAPCSISTRAISTLPFPNALCSGVRPL